MRDWIGFLLGAGAGVGATAAACYVYNRKSSLFFDATPPSTHGLTKGDKELWWVKGPLPSPEYIAFDAMLRAGQSSRTEGWDYQKLRKELPNFGAFFGSTIYATPKSRGKVPCLDVAVPGVRANKIILYAHGGGYLAGSPEIYSGFLEVLSRATNRRVVGVDYRLAPESRLPAAVDDMQAVYTELLKGNRAEDIALMGDSAGGGLVLLTLQRLVRDGQPRPSCAVPISPYADLSASQPWEDKLGLRDCMIGSTVDHDTLRNQIRNGARQAAPEGGDLKSPTVSPVFGSFDKLPPLYILVGEAEVLRPEAELCAQKAKKAGVTTKLEIAPNMCHVYPAFHKAYPEAQQALGRIADFLDLHSP